MRLIDADNIYNVGDFVILHKDGNAYVSLANLCKLIDIQPIAYDVDKVVEKLEDFRYEAEMCGYSGALSDIIEVVKGGGTYETD